MERRGASHIEVILAFLLFISAVTAAIYFFSPSYKGGVAESTIDYAYKAIKDNLQAELTTYYVNVPYGSGGLWRLSNFPIGKIRVEKYDGTGTLDYSIINGCIDPSGSEVVVIYSSEGITNGNEEENVICSDEGISSSQATISSSVKESVISEDKAKKMKEDYNLDYEALKSNLNIPAGRDFSFSLVFSANYKIVGEKNIPRGISVYAKSEKLKVIMEDGKREFADLIVKIW